MKFLKECVADDCCKERIGDTKQLCIKHQEMYEKGESFKAFYGNVEINKKTNNYAN